MSRIFLLLALASLFVLSCTAEKAIEEGTSCEEECPVGGEMVSTKEAGGACGADGSYHLEGTVEASGECKGTGSCEVVCLFPECEGDKTLVITADEYRCEGYANPCDNEDCDGHGTCKIVNDAPTCDCDPGYDAAGLHCEAPEDPVVISVTPNKGIVDADAVFTVSGQYLPLTLAADVENCEGVSFTDRTDTEQIFTCVPTLPGTMIRQIFITQGGAKIYEDEAIFSCEDCEIDGKCWADGELNPDDDCQMCDKEKDDDAWSPSNTDGC